MEDFKDDGSWFNNPDTTSSIGEEGAPLMDLWDPMIFSDQATLAGTSNSYDYAISSIDEMMTATQNAQGSTSVNQEMAGSLNNETISTDLHASQSYNFLEEESNGDLKKKVEGLSASLYESKKELITLQGQSQMIKSELYTIKSNHAQILRWTLDMNESVKALLKLVAENVGANIVGHEEHHMEDLGSWANSASGS